MVKRAGDGGQPNPASYLGAGLTWALSTLLFLWLGSKADEWLETRPWLTLVGAFVGAAAGFYYMIHHLLAGTARQGSAGADRKSGPERE